MTSTIYTYSLTGGRVFPVAFEYLARRFVSITLVGATRLELQLNVDYRFISKTEIETTIAWPPGTYQTLEVRRVTSATDRLVNFTDGSILRSQDLNISQIQAIHIAEEGRDVADSALISDGFTWDALGRQIRNVGYPDGATDATTVGYVLDQVGRTLRGTQADRLIEIPTDRANKILAFDSAGQPIAINTSTGQAVALEIEMLDPKKGAKTKVAYEVNKITRSIQTAGDAIDGLVLSLWNFAKFATGYSEGGDPSSWDWSPALTEADLVLTAIGYKGGKISVKAGLYGLGTPATLTGLSRNMEGEGSTCTEFKALPSLTGNVMTFKESSYCTVSGIKFTGNGSSGQIGLYMPYRVSVGVILQNLINDVQCEVVSSGIVLENPVHCTLIGVRTTRDCTQFGLHSQFIAGVGAGQGGTNLRLLGCWFQAHGDTGTSARINSNLNFSSIGTQYEHGRFGLVLRSCSGATLVSPLFEDCGQMLTLQGCTNFTLLSGTIDAGTTPDLGGAIQPLIDIDGGYNIRIIGLLSTNDDKVYVDALVRFLKTSYGSWPDNVTLDGVTSQSNKPLIGSENVTNLKILGKDSWVMRGLVIKEVRIQPVIWKAPPPSPTPGEEFIADGVLWKPVPGGRAKVVYQGSGVYKLIYPF